MQYKGAYILIAKFIERVIPHQINAEKRHFQPDLIMEWFFCETAVPMEINIPVKFY
jgi:hypothetical protein